jgi:hypothetical protein
MAATSRVAGISEENVRPVAGASLDELALTAGRGESGEGFLLLLGSLAGGAPGLPRRAGFL